MTGGQLRAIESQRLVEPLLTSWFDVTNYSSVSRPTPWRTGRMLKALAPEDLQENLRAVGELSEDRKPSVNCIIKLRLYPTTTQREKLEHMFATNRAAYSMLVARSKDGSAMRLVLRGKRTRTTR
ncbi:hypothetical protein DVH05_017049 [Phytophthora capsici]|nr:hypothetical protein DVH05_017049 [Phytophthora capsici]